MYLNVNERFRDENGRDYIGSRDIDVGFRLDPSVPLEDTEFAKVFRELQASGFMGQSYRMYKVYDRETGKELTDAESNGKPDFELLILYIDLVVDQIPEDFSEVFGFVPIDEPLLADAYSNDRFVDVLWERLVLRVVDPVYLVCMKLRSVVGRTKDHKRVKDISDLYALMWYGGVSLRELSLKAKGILGDAFVKKVLGSVTRGEIDQVAGVLGVESGQISRVFSQFQRA